ncbi:tail fiber domain-containing protein [Nannocystaceae bacterium ST9]
MAITTKPRKDLKSYFVKNAIPTEGNFAEMIDAGLNQADDGVFKLPGEPLSVVAAGGDQRRTLRLYAAYPSANPDWLISLNPAQDPANPATNRPGFGVADGAGNTRLFIDSATGNLGVGTNNPSDRLHVREGDVLIEGGRYRRLKIVSDKYWAGIELVTREIGEAGCPHIDFTHGQLDAPNFGTRLSGPNNTTLTLEAGTGAANLDVRGGVSYTTTLSKLDVAEQGAATIRASDLVFGHSGRRGTPGRAIVDAGSSLIFNYASDWPRADVNGPLTAGKLTIGATDTTYPLDVRVPGGLGSWDRFVVTTTTAWGDAGSQHVTIGAGGAAGIMLTNPHVPWLTGESRASIRYGRTGGAAGKTWWDAGVRADGSFGFVATDDGGVGKVVELAKTGSVTTPGFLRASGGVIVDGNLSTHVDTDGAFYRYQGQVYITVDDNLYIRDTDNQVRMHFDTNNGVLKTDVLRLGDKWRFSAIGDAHGNDDWLRMFGTDNAGYYGGFASGRLYTLQGSLSGSDIQLKTDVAPLPDVLDKLLSLRGVEFGWKSSQPPAAEKSSQAGREIGMIAQEVEQVFPELVGIGPDGMKGIKYDGFTALLIEALKQQQAQITALQHALTGPRA